MGVGVREGVGWEGLEGEGWGEVRYTRTLLEVYIHHVGVRAYTKPTLKCTGNPFNLRSCDP